MLKLSHHPAKFGRHRHCGSGDVFNLSRDLGRLHDYMVMCLYGQKPIKVRYHPAKFSGHRHSGSGNIDLGRPRDQRVMLFYELKPIKVSYHHAKFDGHFLTVK